VIICLATVTNC